MLTKAYVEIINHCNLSCSFCPKTRRESRTMTAQEFEIVAQKLRGQVQYLYLHIMGEPLLHPQLSEIFEIADAYGFKVCVTTNGTLLPKNGKYLLAAQNIYKVSISLHSLEGSGAPLDMQTYLDGVWDFCDQSQQKEIYTVLRLWNGGAGQRSRNGEILAYLEKKLGRDPLSVSESRNHSRSFYKYLFLECEDKFDWPDLSAQETGTQYCLGLRNQIGVLADGTVVPCCLDHEGDIPLGNIFHMRYEEIINGERARKVYDGFSCRAPKEELCKKCGFATRFNKTI